VESPTALTKEIWYNMSARFIYLYVKTHNKTGMKYLGKTVASNPHSYRGSGKYWKKHINKHGNDVTTKILLKTTSEEELKQTGLFFSRLFNVVESSDWANLMVEAGGDRKFTMEERKRMSDVRVGKPMSEEEKKRRSDTMKRKGILPPNHTGKKRSDEFKRKISDARKGKKLSEEHKEKLRGRTISAETKKKMSEKAKGRTHSEETKRKMRESQSKRRVLESQK
jgi:hypothetical protein